VGPRIFGGQYNEEAAQHPETSVATVNRRRSAGKSWLIREFSRA
jgi:hypothetical protein